MMLENHQTICSLRFGKHNRVRRMARKQCTQSLGNCQVKYNAQRKKSIRSQAGEADMRGIRRIHSKYPLITFFSTPTLAVLPMVHDFLAQSQNETEISLFSLRKRKSFRYKCLNTSILAIFFFLIYC